MQRVDHAGDLHHHDGDADHHLHDGDDPMDNVAGHHARDPDPGSSRGGHGSLHRLLYVHQRCLPGSHPT